MKLVSCLIVAASAAVLFAGTTPIRAASDGGISTLAGPAGKSTHHHRKHMKKKAHAKTMKKAAPDGAGENKQTPTGGQPGGGIGKS